MKKFFKNINLQVFKIRVIQIVLILVGIISFDESNTFGHDFRFYSGEPVLVGENKIHDPDYHGFGSNQYRVESIYKETHPTYIGGSTGGAIGMAIVCATCIICVVILEILVFIRKKSIND
jgi:hypothetical protein